MKLRDVLKSPRVDLIILFLVALITAILLWVTAEWRWASENAVIDERIEAVLTRTGLLEVGAERAAIIDARQDVQLDSLIAILRGSEVKRIIVILK